MRSKSIGAKRCLIFALTLINPLANALNTDVEQRPVVLPSKFYVV